MMSSATRNRACASSVLASNLVAILLATFLSHQAAQAQRDGAPTARPTPAATVIRSGAQPPSKAAAATSSDEAKKGSSDTEAPGDESDEAKDGEEKEEEKADESIKRPTTPPENVDPTELHVRPGADGRIRFNFHGQAWLGILEWLAENSNLSLDWQELPADYVNLTTTRSYTLPEALDLFNRLLLDRGYTMVQHDRILSVFRIENLDPSLLRRVDDESELLDLPPHDFVKITFKLPSKLKVDQVAEDVKPLLSPHAKVQPLVATNRLLLVDAVINLREVSRLLNAEHAAALGHTVPNEFMVRFARADQVADQVMILLGLDPSSRRTPQELQVEQQRLQLFQQMQQKGKDVTKFLRPSEAPKVFLAVNHRNNSILANAPPDEMKVIERAIQQLDVPSDFGAGVAAGALSLNKYQLVSISPQAIVTALEEIGNLDPRTRLQTDTEASTIFASATAADHQKIKSMIDSLDGSGRELEVIWLRRLPANAVAATLQNLMIGKEKEEDSNSRPFYYYSYSRSREPEKPASQFRVDADMEKNRLLLWANESELREVRKFLEKLGEIPGQSGNPHTVRYLDSKDNDATLQILRRLQQMWDGPNKLQIDLPDKSGPEDPKTTARPRPDDRQARRGRIRPGSRSFAFTSKPGDQQLPGQTEKPVAALPKEATKDGAAPITITMAPDGRIMLHSNDPTALDHLEDLLASLTPPAPDYKVFYLKYALASLVTINLEEYFEEEGDFDTQDNWWRAYYGFGFETADKGDGGLSQQRKIRFIYDYDTNSILVSGASPRQLAVVESLIDIYDKPPSEDSISARSFRIFKLEYARAEAVSKTIKEVFRDLLSSKDKDFDSRRKDEKQDGSQTTNYYRIYGEGDEGNDKGTKVKASFEGSLSVGVDQASNTLIVSAQEEWMPSIAEMIEYLDEQSRPEVRVGVYDIDGQISPKTLRSALTQVLGDKWVGQRPSETTVRQPQATGLPIQVQRDIFNGSTTEPKTESPQ